MTDKDTPPADLVPKGEVGGMPRWVKVFGIVAGLLLLLFVVLHLSGLSPTGHGP